MARVDQQAAQEELHKAARLNEKADELVEVAEQLKEEAQRLERDAESLVAPQKPHS
jgi:hypothetical protein